MVTPRSFASRVWVKNDEDRTWHPAGCSGSGARLLVCTPEHLEVWAEGDKPLKVLVPEHDDNIDDPGGHGTEDHDAHAPDRHHPGRVRGSRRRASRARRPPR